MACAGMVSSVSVSVARSDATAVVRRRGPVRRTPMRASVEGSGPVVGVTMPLRLGRRGAVLQALGAAAAVAAGAAAAPEARAAGGEFGNKAPINILKPDKKYLSTKGDGSFIPVVEAGEYAAQIPAQYAGTPERDLPGMVAKFTRGYGESVSIVQLGGKGKRSVSDYGSLDDFVGKELENVFGQQVSKVTGNAKVGDNFSDSRAFILDAAEFTDADGTLYYRYEILTQTADGDEGGKRNYVSAAVGPTSGKLYALIFQQSEKKWVKEFGKTAKATWEAFRVL